MSSADPTLRWLAVQERASELQQSYPGWRRGQALFNALYAIDPVLADSIRGTAADPFHQDSAVRLGAFAAVVMSVTGEPS